MDSASLIQAGQGAFQQRAGGQPLGLQMRLQGEHNALQQRLRVFLGYGGRIPLRGIAHAGGQQQHQPFLKLGLLVKGQGL